MAASSAAVAGKTFELNNNVQTVDPDQIYSTDTAAQREILKARPWKNDPGYFKNVKIAATALVKMVRLPFVYALCRVLTRQPC